MFFGLDEICYLPTRFAPKSLCSQGENISGVEFKEVRNKKKTESVNIHSKRMSQKMDGLSDVCHEVENVW